jgi:hypothetical protein
MPQHNPGTSFSNGYVVPAEKNAELSVPVCYSGRENTTSFNYPAQCAFRRV